MQSPTRLQFGEQDITAHPEYHPQRPDYFAEAPWRFRREPQWRAPRCPAVNRTPFWKKAMMIGGVVAGGEMLGDLLGSGGDRDDGGGWGGDDGGDWDSGGW